eukprot:14281570-Alexandrium_andersonii.AAC.1
MGIRRLFEDLPTCYSEHRAPKDYQLGDLTPGMLGAVEHPDLKVEAGERGVLLGWAVWLVARYARAAESPQ